MCSMQADHKQDEKSGQQTPPALPAVPQDAPHAAKDVDLRLTQEEKDQLFKDLKENENE